MGVTSVRLAAALLLSCAVVAGCTSGSVPKNSSTAPSTSPQIASTAVAPTTSAPVTTAAPKPAPLSKFESDPGIKAFRLWAVEAARTVNSGHDTSAKLKTLMTQSFAKTMHNILGGDVGKYYPGPVPFQPLRVIITDASHHRSDGCAYAEGFAENRRTHKVDDKRKIMPVSILTVIRSGRWVVDNLTGPAQIGCAGIAIRTQRW